jgi:RNA polymerase-interacting CarD/CdnL/TRCF family regulator
LKKAEARLKTGDYIVHAAHGIGEVKGTDIKAFRGTEKIYYQIKTQDLIYWLPVEDSKTDHVRSVCAPSTFSKALSIIRKKPQNLNNNFRIRVNHLKEEQAKCSLTSSARLLRDLNARNTIKDLHINELRVLDKLKANFVNEYSVACSLDWKEAESRLDDALAEGLAKMSIK